ncbi:MAG: large-conductance mechanosensitive channel protein MscL [Clostridia bacterium]|nr:large-conductance mechanosensitive channel protein MscL [Clostridia bacterium]
MKKIKFIEEFKAFIAKGNVIDMAVAVVVGGAFGKIVTSLVNDIIMPLIGLITGGFNVKDAKWVIEAAVMDGETVVTPEVALTYGVFIQTIIDFLLVALSIFIFLKIILAAKSKFEKKEEEIAEEAPAEEPKETTEDILSEIRDLLKNKNN